MLCSQEREVKIGEEERMRTKLKRESWCSRKMDKVRVKYGANDATSFSGTNVGYLLDVCFVQNTLK